MVVKRNKQKVVLGFSGGVDSTAAALLLKEKGLQVTGLFFDVVPGPTAAAEEAKKRAEEVGIDFLYKDVSEAFKEAVIGDFCACYASGKTPNPCIRCNPAIKFATLIDGADEIGAEYIATGHYAQVKYLAEEDCYAVYRARNLKKDQSYMLYRLGQEVLSRLILPLGQFESKEEIRAMLREEAISNAEQPDSQEICFLPDDTEYADYLQRQGVKAVPGEFTDREGNVLGRHKGLVHYTIGQRKGLGVALGKPMFVVELDSENNRVILGENQDLFRRDVLIEDIKITEKCYGKAFGAQGKVRYLAPAAQAFVKPAETAENAGESGCKDRLLVTFEQPQRAPAPGQSLVLYDGDRVLGGGIIITK